MNKIILCVPLLLLVGCNANHGADNTAEINSPKTNTATSTSKKTRCHSMPPIQDKTKLINMLIKSGEISASDSEQVKNEKLEHFISQKLKGAQRCKK